MFPLEILQVSNILLIDSFFAKVLHEAPSSTVILFAFGINSKSNPDHTLGTWPIGKCLSSQPDCKILLSRNLTLAKLFLSSCQAVLVTAPQEEYL